MRWYLSLGLLLLPCFCSCSDNDARSLQGPDGAEHVAAAVDDSERPELDDGTEPDSMLDHDAVVGFLAASFEQLPEAQNSISENGSVYAQYAQPTDRYGHGILGDRIEAGELVVLRDGVTYTHTLDERFVYEDIRPRLSDVDGDGEAEVVTIRTEISQGAGIMIYKVEAGNLSEYAWVEEIGTPSRWLNIAAIYDLDNDGNVELAWRPDASHWWYSSSRPGFDGRALDTGGVDSLQQPCGRREKLVPFHRHGGRERGNSLRAIPRPKPDRRTQIHRRHARPDRDHRAADRLLSIALLPV